MTLVAAVVVLGVIIGEVAADVVDSGRAAGRVAAETYVAELIPVVEDSTGLANTMHLVRNSAATLDRTSLERALGNLVTGTAENRAQLLSLGVPAPTARSGRLLETALDDRSEGARDLAQAVALAISPASGTTQARASAASLVVKAGKALIVGDEDYVNFVRSLPRYSHSGRLPASRWVHSPSSWVDSSAVTWVAQLSTLPKLEAHEDLVIVALTLQPPVVRINGLPTTTTTPPTTTTSSTTTTSTTTTTPTTIPGATTSSTTSTTSTTTTSTSTTTTTTQLPPSSSTSVLPPTERVSVVLVVKNSGNVALSGIWAAASVVPEFTSGPTGKGPATGEHSTAVRIGQLAPAASVVVTLPALEVSTGRQYTLWAAIGTGKIPQGPVTQPPTGVGQLDEVRIKVASA